MEMKIGEAVNAEFVMARCYILDRRNVHLDIDPMRQRNHHRPTLLYNVRNRRLHLSRGLLILKQNLFVSEAESLSIP